MMTHTLRCRWIEGKPEYYVSYHDNVWGKPEHDDRQLFKWLLLEMFHIGLSWQLVLSKEQAFCEAFEQYDYDKIANYTPSHVEVLLNNPSIIRHRGKINAAITNAQAFIRVQQEWGSFDRYIWSFTQGQTLMRQTNEAIARSQLSDTVAHDMKKRGFKFIGSVTIYSYLQAIGIVNDHDMTCAFRL